MFGDSVLRTGQPTYLMLTRRLSLAFDYSFASDSPSSITGTTSLAVEVSDINGWTRRLVLQEPQPFEGATARAGGILNLGVISGYLEALSAQPLSQVSTRLGEPLAGAESREGQTIDTTRKLITSASKPITGEIAPLGHGADGGGHVHGSGPVHQTAKHRSQRRKDAKQGDWVNRHRVRGPPLRAFDLICLSLRLHAFATDVACM